MRKYIISTAVLVGFGVAATGFAQAATVGYTDFAQFQAASGTLTTDGFETAPWSPNTTMAQGTTSFGVSWSAANFLYVGGSLARTGTGSLTSLDIQGSDLFDVLEAALPGGITAIGGWFTSFGQAHDVTLKAFDANDTLLGTLVAGPSVGNSYKFIGLTSTTAIARISLASTSVTNPIGDDFALDDFVFGVAGPSNPPAEVPEPATIALLGAGLLGLGLLRRRQRG